MITAKQVKQLWEDALEEFGAESVDKSDSYFMGMVGWFLNTIGVLEKDNFLNNFTTTVGDVIYRPFEIGIARGYHLEGQASILAHELVHVRQYKEDPVVFPVNYVTNKSARALYEAKAFAADLEIFHWFNGRLYNIPQRVASLRHYGLDSAHIEFAETTVMSLGDTILLGASVSPVAAWILDWFEANGVTRNE